MALTPGVLSLGNELKALRGLQLDVCSPVPLRLQMLTKGMLTLGVQLRPGAQGSGVTAYPCCLQSSVQRGDGLAKGGLGSK